MMLCPMCNEEIAPGDVERNRPTTLYTEDGPRATHRECMLREVMGGIGHLIAHEYWCTQRHDPDGGLTRRQSSLLVDAYVHVMGVDAAAAVQP